MAYRSTKTFGHELGLSCCFRQHGATHSHCSLLHGYALSIRLEFEAQGLDYRNWVVDFGGLKGLKESIKGLFDHKLVVAEDDPMKDMLFGLQELGLADVVELPAVGCEAFAKTVYDMADRFLNNEGLKPRVRLVSVEVCEHGANSAIYLSEAK